jgi:hypothetical protein
VGAEVAHVAVEVDDYLAAGDRERSPHRVALAEHLAEVGHQLGLGDDFGAGGVGDLRGPVGGVGIDD